MKKRIVISVTSDLSTDQRVLKVAHSCFNNGFDVLLVGRLLKNSKPLDLPFKHKRMKLMFVNSAFFYAEYNIRLFFLLLFSRSNILFSNDSDTLLANYFVSKIRRKKLIFDAHELFPELPELTVRPKVKMFWGKLEDWIFPNLTHSFTVCNSIAEYYKTKYNIQMQVLRNVPYYRYEKKKEPKISFKNKKIILYQGAINKGRGLEWVIDAMPFIENVKLVIIGDGDIRKELELQIKKLNLEDKVEFLGKIAGEKLHEYTPSAAISLCLLEELGLSYYFSLPNRIFDSIQAGVPVLATRFPEITNIVENHNTGILIDHYEPKYLAKTINEMLENPFDTSHFEAVAKEFCWENEEKVLMEVLEKN
ncbi:MAG: glycosyltransferase family 4 protein [Paludibacter sp.]